MITTADVKDYIKGLQLADHCYIGKIDNKQNKSIGVYSLRYGGPPVTALGKNSSYDIIGVSILIHWNENAAQTEEAARSLYEHFRTASQIIINDHTVLLVDLLVPEPIDVGTDDKGIYERVIEMKIYYERK